MKNNKILKIISLILILLIISLIVIVSIRKFTNNNEEGNDNTITTEDETYKTQLDGKYTLDNTSIILFSLNDEEMGFVIFKNDVLLSNYIKGTSTINNDKTKAIYINEDLGSTYTFELQDNNIKLTIEPKNEFFANSVYQRNINIPKKDLLLDYIFFNSNYNKTDFSLDYLNSKYTGIYKNNNCTAYLLQYSKDKIYVVLNINNYSFNNQVIYVIKDNKLVKYDSFDKKEDDNHIIELSNNKIIVKNTEDGSLLDEEYNGTYEKTNNLSYEDIAFMYSDLFMSLYAN